MGGRIGSLHLGLKEGGPFVGGGVYVESDGLRAQSPVEFAFGSCGSCPQVCLRQRVNPKPHTVTWLGSWRRALLNHSEAHVVP